MFSIPVMQFGGQRAEAFAPLKQCRLQVQRLKKSMPRRYESVDCFSLDLGLFYFLAPLVDNRKIIKEKQKLSTRIMRVWIFENRLGSAYVKQVYLSRTAHFYHMNL